MNGISQTPTRIVAAFLTVTVGATLAQDYAIDWHTIDGGGEMWSTGGSYELGGTIGQPDAGLMSGGDYVLSGGFWLPPCPGDLDGDGFRNVTDFTALASAYGSQVGDPNYSPAADMNGDGFINVTDFTRFAAVYGVPCP